MQWANRQGKALALVRCAHEQNPGHAELAALYVEAQGWGVAEPGSNSAPTTDTPPSPSGTGHHVFLAYSRKDTATMQRLRADLHTAGIGVWIDEEDLEPGTPQWQRTIHTRDSGSAGDGRRALAGRQ